MPIDQWIGDAAVVDLTHLGANGEVSAAELDKRGTHVRRGDIVLLRTDWPRKESVESPQFWKEGPFTDRADASGSSLGASRRSGTTTRPTTASATPSPSHGESRAAASTRPTRS